MANTELIEKLQTKYNGALQVGTDNFYDILTIEKENLHDLCLELKDAGFNYLANLTAVDFEDRFEVVYHLHLIPGNQKIALKSVLDYDKPEVTSVIDIWKTADWQEREVYDLLGINFVGHPNLIRILLPDDYTEHPLRKSFKLK